MTSHCSVKTTEGIFGFALHLLHSTDHAEAMKGRDWKLIFLAKPLTSHSRFPVIKFHLSSLKAEIKGANSWIIFIPGHIKFVKAKKKKKFSVALSSSLELSSDRTRGAGLPSLGLFWTLLRLHWAMRCKDTRETEQRFTLTKRILIHSSKWGSITILIAFCSQPSSWGGWRFLRMENSSASHFNCNNSRRAP